MNVSLRLSRCTLLLIGIVALGCGGETGTRSSTVSGLVLDIDNNPVRNALVSTRFGNTRTSAVGAYELPKQAEGMVEVAAEVVRNGVHYKGRTTVFTYANEATQSANIVVGPSDELSVVRGVVRDRGGNPLQDASVYAYNGAGSSMRAFSDSNGTYVLADLVGGLPYTVLAGGQGYRSDSVQVNLGVRDDRSIDFTLDDPGLPNLQPPQNVASVTWVSPQDATRGVKGDPYEALKRMIDPRRSHRQARSGQTRQPGGTLAEVDLFWDAQQFPDLLGYGVYRASSANGQLNGVDLLPEPLAALYVDLSVGEASTLSYALTTVSAQFPNHLDQTESDLSARVVARTLSTLVLRDPTVNPLVFRWQSGSGAAEYTVYLFDEFPSIGVNPVWTSTRVAGTTADYDGVALSPGTYYYLVVGWANNDSSRTISQVGTLRL